MKNILNRIICIICNTVLKNLPFFVIFSALLSFHVISGFLNDAMQHFSSNNFADSFGILVFNLSEVLACAFCLCLLFYFVKYSFLKYVMYAFAFLLFGINMYLRVCFGTLISSSTLLLIAETNKREMFEFFETYLFNTSGIIIVISVLTIGVLIYWIETWYKKREIGLGGRLTQILLSIGIILVIGLAIIESTLYVQNFKNQSFSQFEILLSQTQKYSRMDYCRRLINSLFLLKLAGEETDQAVALAGKAIDEADCIQKDDAITIVLVIGESFIKSHASIYGYPLNTMPFVGEENAKGNVIAYQNAITTALHTSMALRNFFSCNSVGDGERWSESSFFPALFKAAGYDVYFWDNQYDYLNQTDLDFALNAYIHHSDISRQVYSSYNKSSFRYDGDLVDDFEKSCLNELKMRNKNSLVMFHLMGQHFKSDKRYPHTADFCRFNSDSILRNNDYLTPVRKEEIAQYDNSVLYNDYVIKKIVEIFIDRNSILIFFSDHGELIYDISDVKGRTMKMEAMTFGERTHYYEIPLLFWFSEQFKSKEPELVDVIEKCKDRNFMNDNLCQILFHIGNIHTRWYHSKRDVLSPDYQCPPRIIENSINYDE